MRVAHIVTNVGTLEDVPAYELSDFPWPNMPDWTLSSRKKSPKEYFGIITTFDIETTTIIPAGYKPGVKLLADQESPWGFMYHWQMCIGGVCCYGRRWSEWLDFLDAMQQYLGASEEKRIVIWVHNLSFELEFMLPFLVQRFGSASAFASKPRKVMRLTVGPFEFRCSYFLSNMSLHKATTNELGVVHIKAKGDLDYKKIRTADTYLDDTEFGYCISDVVSLYEFIKCKNINEHDSLASMPMTSTGYVRRDMRRATRKDKRYREKVFLKCGMTVLVYELLKEEGRGGNTHGNRTLAGKIQYDADSFDIVSSYPFQLFKKYPMSAFQYYGNVTSEKELDELLEKYACLFRVRFQNIRLKPGVPIPYIPISKCWEHSGDLRLDNGRVMGYRSEAGGTICMTLNNIDYEIIKSQYTWDNFEVFDFHIAEWGYLPECILEVVREYYKAKCELKEKIALINEKKKKGIASADDLAELANLKYLYGKQKNRLNGIFGMMYTDPVRPEIVLDADSMHWKPPGVPDIAEKLGEFMKSRNSFLVYAWGSFCTSYGRQSFQDLIDTQRFPIYGDTDSCKSIQTDYAAIEALNEKIKVFCEERRAYADVDGIRFYMGIYEHENTDGKIKEFITLGAKKYAYIDEYGELHVTVSGVNKEWGAKELEKIENFRLGFKFRKAGGQTLYYHDDPSIHEIEVGGCRMQTASNIGLVDSEYTLGITGEYAEVIGYNVSKELYFDAE